jgi:uncharacterized membrane protein
MKAIVTLKRNHRLELTALLFYSSVFSASLLWNLFLAGIPYLVSLKMYCNRRTQSRRSFWLQLMLWLLFLPNAPYIVTDFLHLRQVWPVPLWYDLLILMSFAWNGLMLGFFSLMNIQECIAGRYGIRISWAFTIMATVMCSFGIFLGRYRRWNSWDIITDPLRLFSDIAEKLFNPTEFPQAYGITFSFSLFLLFGYLILKQLTLINQTPYTHEDRKSVK